MNFSMRMERGLTWSGPLARLMASQHRMEEPPKTASRDGAKKEELDAKEGVFTEPVRRAKAG